jgi:hypothetical protein
VLTNRREFLVAIPALVFSACEMAKAPTAPSASRLAPLDLVVSSNGTTAPPTYHGYASGGENLIAAMRSAGLNPEPILPGNLGVGTYRFSITPEFGWILAVNNTVFGSDAANVTLGQDQLWAAYKKLSLG